MLACRLAPLVRLELQAEQDAVQQRLHTWPLARLRSEGLVLMELRGSKRGSFLGKPIVRLLAGGSGELPFHRFT